MSDQRGFKNVAIVNRSIRELFLRLSPRRIGQFGTTFELVAGESDKSADPVIRVQRIARHLAYHYQINVSAVIVTFRSNLGVPGRVELTNDLDFFVELDSKYKDDVRSTVAILAHEIAHIFLHQKGIRFEQTFDNEVLTDTAAILLGCGQTILNAAVQTKTSSFYGLTITTTTSSSHFGYISIDEMGYVQAKRDLLFRSKPSRLVRRGFPRSGYRHGRWAFRAQCRRRPYARFKTAAGILTELANLFRRKSTDRKTRKMTFACVFCSQQIRIPILGKKLAVHCPVCEQTRICHT